MPPVLPPYVLALDPGKKTGYCLYDTVNDTLVNQGEDQFAPTCAWVEHYASTLGSACQLITEKFTITVRTARNSQAPWSLEMIGVARWLSQKYTGRDLLLQDVAAAKRFASNDHLRELGWWQVGTEGHVNDALRHLLLYLAAHGWWSDKLVIDTSAELG
jgi:hypothetical protein